MTRPGTRRHPYAPATESRRTCPAAGRRAAQILEVLDGPGHEHYRVQWTDEHESIFYPADGVVVVASKPPAITH